MHGVHVLPGALAVLLVLVGKLLNMAVSLSGAEPPHGAGQPLPQRVPGAFGAWRAVRTQGLAGAWLQGIVTGYRQGVYKRGVKGNVDNHVNTNMLTFLVRV